MATIFTKIINGEIPSYKIAEDDKHYAFLDINPVVEGHTLVVPKKENDYLFNLEDDELADLMVFAKKVARKLETKIECKRIAVTVIGLEVPMPTSIFSQSLRRAISILNTNSILPKKN